MASNSTCVVTSPPPKSTNVPDGRAGWSNPNPDVIIYNNIWCEVQHRPATEEFFTKLRGKKFAMIHLEPDKEIRMNYSITVDGAITYNVLGVPQIDSDDLTLAVPCSLTSP